MYLLVHNNVYSHTTLSGRLEHGVKSILGILGRRTAEVQLRTQPPVEDVDAFLRA